MKIKLFGIIFVILALAGCSSITDGYITKKTHTDAYSYVTMVCSSYNSGGACTVWVPVTNYVAEQWKFDLKKGQLEGWVYVDEDTYNSLDVGDRYSQE